MDPSRAHDRLDPKLDVVFKLLLTRQPVLLKDMLEGILGRPIRTVTVLNPGIFGEGADDKEVVLDIRALLDDGSRVDVEMQIRPHNALAARLVYYGARDFADQLGRGEDYDLLCPTIVVVWLLAPLLAGSDRLHSIFELRERHTHALFGDQLAIHVLQLGAHLPLHPIGYYCRVVRWARFLTAREDHEFEQLASEDPIMTIAKETLTALSDDPEARRLARYRADEVKLNKIDILASRIEGKAEILLKQLHVRFGPVSAATRARVQSARRSEQLDVWAERVLTAATIEEIFEW